MPMISLVLPDDLFAEFKALVAREDSNVSRHLRQFIRQYVDAYHADASQWPHGRRVYLNADGTERYHEK